MGSEENTSRDGLTTIHGQICRNTRDLGRDLVGEREEPPESALFLRERNREKSALGQARAGAAVHISGCVAPMARTSHKSISLVK
jgi:hypothetical protein